MLYTPIRYWQNEVGRETAATPGDADNDMIEPMFISLYEDSAIKPYLNVKSPLPFGSTSIEPLVKAAMESLPNKEGATTSNIYIPRRIIVEAMDQVPLSALKLPAKNGRFLLWNGKTINGTPYKAAVFRRDKDSEAIQVAVKYYAISPDAATVKKLGQLSAAHDTATGANKSIYASPEEQEAELLGIHDSTCELDRLPKGVVERVVFVNVMQDDTVATLREVLAEKLGVPGDRLWIGTSQGASDVIEPIGGRAARDLVASQIDSTKDFDIDELLLHSAEIFEHAQYVTMQDAGVQDGCTIVAELASAAHEYKQLLSSSSSSAPVDLTDSTAGQTFVPWANTVAYAVNQAQRRVISLDVVVALPQFCIALRCAAALSKGAINIDAASEPSVSDVTMKVVVRRDWSANHLKRRVAAAIRSKLEREFGFSDLAAVPHDHPLRGLLESVVPIAPEAARDFVSRWIIRKLTFRGSTFVPDSIVPEYIAPKSGLPVEKHFVCSVEDAGLVRSGQTVRLENLPWKIGQLTPGDSTTAVAPVHDTVERITPEELTQILHVAAEARLREEQEDTLAAAEAAEAEKDKDQKRKAQNLAKQREREREKERSKRPVHLVLGLADEASQGPGTGGAAKSGRSDVFPPGPRVFANAVDEGLVPVIVAPQFTLRMLKERVLAVYAARRNELNAYVHHAALAMAKLAGLSSDVDRAEEKQTEEVKSDSVDALLQLPAFEFTAFRVTADWEKPLKPLLNEDFALSVLKFTENDGIWIQKGRPPLRNVCKIELYVHYIAPSVRGKVDDIRAYYAEKLAALGIAEKPHSDAGSTKGGSNVDVEGTERTVEVSNASTVDEEDNFDIRAAVASLELLRSKASTEAGDEDEGDEDRILTKTNPTLAQAQRQLLQTLEQVTFSVYPLFAESSRSRSALQPLIVLELPYSTTLFALKLIIFCLFSGHTKYRSPAYMSLSTFRPEPSRRGMAYLFSSLYSPAHVRLRQVTRADGLGRPLLGETQPLSRHGFKTGDPKRLAIQVLSPWQYEFNVAPDTEIPIQLCVSTPTSAAIEAARASSQQSGQGAEATDSEAKSNDASVPFVRTQEGESRSRWCVIGPRIAPTVVWDRTIGLPVVSEAQFERERQKAKVAKDKENEQKEKERAADKESKDNEKAQSSGAKQSTVDSVAKATEGSLADLMRQAYLTVAPSSRKVIFSPALTFVESCGYSRPTGANATVNEEGASDAKKPTKGKGGKGKQQEEAEDVPIAPNLESEIIDFTLAPTASLQTCYDSGLLEVRSRVLFNRAVAKATGIPVRNLATYVFHRPSRSWIPYFPLDPCDIPADGPDTTPKGSPLFTRNLEEDDVVCAVDVSNYHTFVESAAKAAAEDLANLKALMAASVATPEDSASDQTKSDVDRPSGLLALVGTLLPPPPGVSWVRLNEIAEETEALASATSPSSTASSNSSKTDTKKTRREAALKISFD